jgi:ribosomal protein S18 acetylase RimI-like enzyme
VSQVCTRPAQTWAVRYTEPRDLAPVVHLAAQVPAPPQVRPDFLRGFPAHDVSSWVAAVDAEVVGFVACRFVLPRKWVGLTREAAEAGGPPAWPLRLELLHIAVAPEQRRRGVGRALMARVEEWLRQPGDCVRARVPESNLALQLFLRSLGYKAVRVLRGHYGEEDAYVLERRRD